MSRSWRRQTGYGTSWPAWSRESSSGFRSGYRMVQRSESSADTWSSGDGAVHEVQPAGHGRLERPAERKAGGDGGGEGAAGAMQRLRFDPRAAEVADSIGRHQHVGDLLAGEVSSLHQ